MYKVYLDDEFIYGVTSFEDESGRDISIYDGVGQGNFPVPESQDLHKWSLECELSEVNDMNHKEWKKASEIFEHLEKILGQKESVRLVITSAYTNLSELVFLEKYSKSEKVNGIFDVQMSFVQYKAVGARTEDVPYVERPGKIPVPPKAVVKNAYKTEKKYTGKTPSPRQEEIHYTGSGIMGVLSGQIIDNPNSVPDNAETMIYAGEYAARQNAYSGKKEEITDVSQIHSRQDAYKYVAAQNEKNKNKKTMSFFGAAKECINQWNSMSSWGDLFKKNG